MDFQDLDNIISYAKENNLMDCQVTTVLSIMQEEDEIEKYVESWQ